ncbi:hypothetical protein N7450_008874 [Penicillium hetheringtonii]|uniref:Uncharacterized protein n=1 Tax=Penicillium hetheringtonii TaxID=911720 RepID=A0AAD6DE01_9EURO|nr:hypothetical protein N7450_008874 [Penicillium hetheringtonii]
MHSKALALLGLSASVLATAELEKKQYGDSNDYYNSLMSDLNSVATDTDYLNYLTDYTDILNDYTDILSNVPTNYLSDYSHYLTETADYPSATNLGGLGHIETKTTTGGSNMPSVTTGPEMPTLSGDVPPASIQSVLITAIPSSYLSDLADPSARSSMFNEIANGHYPQWYQDLPSNVKSWVSEHYEPTGGPGHAAPGNSAPANGVMASGAVVAAGLLALAVML